jgi:hypothetical protein
VTEDRLAEVVRGAVAEALQAVPADLVAGVAYVRRSILLCEQTHGYLGNAEFTALELLANAGAPDAGGLLAAIEACGVDLTLSKPAKSLADVLTRIARLDAAPGYVVEIVQDVSRAGRVYRVLSLSHGPMGLAC